MFALVRVVLVMVWLHNNRILRRSRNFSKTAGKTYRENNVFLQAFPSLDDSAKCRQTSTYIKIRQV